MNLGQISNGGSTKRITGPGTTAIKYDILTALLVLASRGQPSDARLALRLSLLITARYNWRSGTFAVGQQEMGRMWGVTPRTAKREMAHMRTRGWVALSVPSARGRVARYRIELPVVLRETMPHWDAVGPDFAARMRQEPDNGGLGETNVVPLNRIAEPNLPSDGSLWAAVAADLQAQDPAIYAAWLAPLLALDVEAGTLTLIAANRFQAEYIRSHFSTRVLAAVMAKDPTVRDLQIRCE